jgi:hypothetical protein
VADDLPPYSVVFQGVYKPVADVAEEKQKRGCYYTSSFFIV